MEPIEQNTTEKVTKAVLLRLSEKTYDQCKALSDQANKPLSAVLRHLIEGALAEGVEVVPPQKS
jgi:predicted DNA-binding protein